MAVMFEKLDDSGLLILLFATNFSLMRYLNFNATHCLGEKSDRRVVEIGRGDNFSVGEEFRVIVPCFVGGSYAMTWLDYK